MLILGTEKTQTILELLPESEPYLLLDHGPVIAAQKLPTKRREKSTLPSIKRLDLSKDHLNPLDGIKHTDEGMLKADYFLEVLNAAYPAGKNTLTKQDAEDTILHALVGNKTRTLSHLIPRPLDPKNRGAVDAYRTIQNVLLYPVLERVLDHPTTSFRMDGIVVAHLDPAVLGPRVCFILGNLLIASYPGLVVIPDFGFYAIPSHIQLMRQGRLIAGVNMLAEPRLTPEIRSNLLLMAERIGCHTTFEDAKVLAEYAHLLPDPTRKDNPYNRFIAECMGNIS